MRRFETFIIIDPDQPEEQRQLILQRVQEIMGQLNGFLIRIDPWGPRKLAYPIRKKERGFYVRLDFCGTGALVSEMERFFRIDERVLKYMSVLLDTHPNLEKIQEEMARAAEEAEKPPAEPEPPAAISPAAEAVAAAETPPPPTQPEQPPQEA
jgi:small subunit ribosomal protein S6